MEENTEYTEQEISTEEYIEENTAEGQEENADENGTQPEESGGTTEEPEFSENDTDSGDASDVITDTENNAFDIIEDNAETTEDIGIDDVNLLERVENLLDVLAPETDGENSVNESDENAEPEISEHDMQTLETLQNINETLSAIRTENELFRTETIKYREETKETRQTIINCLEINALLLAGTGFFVALHCGGKFADIFFKRMKGENHV